MRIIALILIFMCANAYSDVWLSTSLYTQHYDANWDWNNKQNLYGIEYEQEHFFVNVSRFENSFNNKSTALLIGSGIDYGWFGFRAALGGATGYKKEYCQQYKNGNWYDYDVTVKLINGEFVAFSDRCKSTSAMLGKYKLLGMASGYLEYKRFRLEASLLGKEAYILTASFKLF